MAKLAGECSSVEHDKYLGIVEPLPRKGRTDTSVGWNQYLGGMSGDPSEDLSITYRAFVCDLP